MGWSAALFGGDPSQSALDSALTREFRARRLAQLVSPADLRASAKRNPTYAADPAVIRAGEAVRRLERNARGALAEPVASQLRVLAGLHDANFALVPVELRFEPAGAQGRAILHLAVVDIRAARLAWSGDVAGDAASTPSPSVLATLAVRVANLIVPR